MHSWFFFFKSPITSNPFFLKFKSIYKSQKLKIKTPITSFNKAQKLLKTHFSLQFSFSKKKTYITKPFRLWAFLWRPKNGSLKKSFFCKKLLGGWPKPNFFFTKSKFINQWIKFIFVAIISPVSHSFLNFTFENMPYLPKTTHGLLQLLKWFIFLKIYNIKLNKFLLF